VQNLGRTIGRNDNNPIVVAHDDIARPDLDPADDNRDGGFAMFGHGGRLGVIAPAEHLKAKYRDIDAVPDRAVEHRACHLPGLAPFRKQIAEGAEPRGPAAIHDKDVLGLCMMYRAMDRAVLTRYSNSLLTNCLVSKGLWRMVTCCGFVKWCPGAESNHRHEDFQSTALPLSYPGTEDDGHIAVIG
jgi:hypothetical protein